MEEAAQNRLGVPGPIPEPSRFPAVAGNPPLRCDANARPKLAPSR
jgi:hypothetical protein